MRKYEKKRRNWLRLRARNEWRRNYHRKKLSSGKLSGDSVGNEFNPTGVEVLERGSETPRVPLPDRDAEQPSLMVGRGKRRKRLTRIMAPSNLSLHTNHDEVSGFVQWLQYLISPNSDGVISKFAVDLSEIERVAPGAGLVLASHFDRWQLETGDNLAAYKPNLWKAPFQRFINDMGLFELLGLDKPFEDLGIDPDATRYVKYVRGSGANGQVCAELLDMLSNVAPKPNAENFIYDGLVEAMKNVGHHAYFDQNFWYGIDRGTWWVCGAYDPTRREMTACVYDPGIGIAKSLPRSTLWEQASRLLEIFGMDDDANRIMAAMQVGRTRTGLDERGKGLPIMMRFFDYEAGELRLVSGRGEVIYSGSGRMQKVSHKTALPGTLIQWTVHD